MDKHPPTVILLPRPLKTIDELLVRLPVMLMFEFGGITRVVLIDRLPLKVQDPLTQVNWGEGGVPGQPKDSGTATGGIAGQVDSRGVGGKLVDKGVLHRASKSAHVALKKTEQLQASVKLK